MERSQDWKDLDGCPNTTNGGEKEGKKGKEDEKWEVSTSQVNISGRSKTLIKHFQRGSKGEQRQKQCQGRFRQHPREVMKTEIDIKKKPV